MVKKQHPGSRVTTVGLLLIAAACGTDDDNGQSSGADATGTGPATGTTPAPADAADVPDWVEIPSKVRESGVLNLDPTCLDLDQQTFGEDPPDGLDDIVVRGVEIVCAGPLPACSIRSDVVAVWAPPDTTFSPLSTMSEVTIGDFGPVLGPGAELAADLDLRVFEVVGGTAEVLRASAQLRSDGVVASPVYELFPAPGRMFFPGSLPTPAGADPVEWSATSPAADGEAVIVHVIDTGFTGTDTRLGDDSSAVPSPNLDELPSSGSLVAGHGTFVTGVIFQNGSSAQVDNIRIPRHGNGQREAGDRFDETDLLEAAAEIRSKGEPSFLTNLSAGSTWCTVVFENQPVELVPVTTLLLVASELAAENRVLVAAAGNTGQSGVITFPAAFADPQILDQTGVAKSIAAQCTTDDSDMCEPLEDFVAVSSRVVAVGANDTTGGESYTTSGPWVTTSRPGCHVSWYPAGDLTYPAFDNDPATTVTFADDADGVPNNGLSLAHWCGTSFATGVVTAEVADMVGQGSDVNTVKTTLLPP